MIDPVLDFAPQASRTSTGDAQRLVNHVREQVAPDWPIGEPIQKLPELRDETRTFVCHDYPGNEYEHRAETSVSTQKHNNIHVGAARARPNW